MIVPIDKDLLKLIRNFFQKWRIELLDKYHRASIIGNTKQAYAYLKLLLAIPFYEDYLFERYPNVEADEIIACIESCNFDFVKLRNFLKRLRGVNIDIIELDLISY